MIPLVPVQLTPEGPAIWCKLEYLNPSGSTKDRIAVFILEKAMRERRLCRGQLVVEASSGSTSIAMARSCAHLGLRFIAVVPAGVSNERVLMIRAYGGAVCFTSAVDGIRGAIAEAERQAKIGGGFLPRQFSNPENAEAHRTGTAVEILDQISGGRVDAVVSGVGTGGTLVGLYQGFVKAGNPVRPFLARPIMLSSHMEEECCGFSSRISGVVDCISTIFVPEEMPELEIIEVNDLEAIETARALIRLGYPVGPSAGLNYLASLRAARSMDTNAQIVTIFPDRMERYFTTELFTPFREETNT